MRKIEEIIEEMRSHAKDGPVLIKEISEKGIPVVGTYCTFVPWEIINAAGAVSASLCAKSQKPIAAAEEHLPRALCPLIKASYGHALLDTCPYFHFCGLVVGETTCDGTKKMYELLDKIKHVYTVQIPQRADRPEDLAILKDEFLKFRDEIEKFTGSKVTDEKLRRSIALRNSERRALKSLWSLMELDNPPLTGHEVWEFSEYMSTHFDKEAAVKWLNRQVADIRAAAEAGEDRGLGKRPRVLVTGCPISGVPKVIDAIEVAGALVVCYENCGGEKELSFLADETKDPMDALAEKYLNIGCSVMSPNKSRMDNLRHLIEKYRVSGVLDMELTSCHTYAVESDLVRSLVHDLGKSFISVETDFSESDKEQLSTRIGAFVEML